MMDIKYEATVVTGLEQMAADECQEKLMVTAKPSQGRIMFNYTDDLDQVLKLRAIDNVYAVIYETEALPKDKSSLTGVLNDVLEKADWMTGLKVWLKSVKFTKSGLESILDRCAAEKELKPQFRVTCNRAGDDHFFSSMEAASVFGGIINDAFHWPVSMKQFDVEVVLNIRENYWYICLALTKESLHRRNLVSFGAATLRSTICYNMLRLADIQIGDIIVDPMCGSSAISIEASINWPNTFNIGGDISSKALDHAIENVKAYNKVEIIKHDATKLSFKTGSVDVFITDFPFGKRLGSKFNNKKLYLSTLLELARCARNESGRAIILTQDKNNMTYTLNNYTLKEYWTRGKSQYAQVGGLNALVYCLKRTAKPFKTD